MKISNTDIGKPLRKIKSVPQPKTVPPKEPAQPKPKPEKEPVPA